MAYMMYLPLHIYTNTNPLLHTLMYRNEYEWVIWASFTLQLAIQNTIIDPMSVTSQQVNSRLTRKCCNKTRLMRQKKIGLFNFRINLKTIFRYAIINVLLKSLCSTLWLSGKIITISSTKF